MLLKLGARELTFEEIAACLSLNVSLAPLVSQNTNSSIKMRNSRLKTVPKTKNCNNKKVAIANKKAVEMEILIVEIL